MSGVRRGEAQAQQGRDGPVPDPCVGARAPQGKEKLFFFLLLITVPPIFDNFLIELPQ